MLIHAFADGERGGNPAGVVLDADGLDPATCQRIAAAASVPETVMCVCPASTFSANWFRPPATVSLGESRLPRRVN